MRKALLAMLLVEMCPLLVRCSTSTVALGQRRAASEDQDGGSPDYEQKSGNSANPMSRRGDFLDQNKRSECSDPRDVNNSAHEEQEHQHPAAPHAIRTVP